jgi:hypothetical protein
LFSSENETLVIWAVLALGREGLARGGGGFHAGTSCAMLGGLEDKKLDLF